MATKSKAPTLPPLPCGCQYTIRGRPVLLCLKHGGPKQLALNLEVRKTRDSAQRELFDNRAA